MKFLRNSFLLGMMGLACTASAQYTGKVFVDQNKNGVFDKNEKVMPGVCVSDGLHVVKTDRKGEYKLEGHDDMRFVFITTPSGYKTNNAYYRRIGDGTTTFDFGIMPYNSHVGGDGSHSFIQITDTEIGEDQGHDDWVGNVRDYAANEGAAFVIQTGDICYIPGMKSHIKLMNTKNMGVPMFYMVGNHDLVAGKYGEELFEELYGPVFYSFDVGNTHYIITPMRGGDYRPSYNFDQVARWMKNDLAMVPEGKPIILLNHDLLTYDDNIVFQGKTEKVDFANYNLKAQIYGHWHINHIHKHGNVPSICTSTPIRGGIDHSTSAFRVYKMGKNGELKTELRYTYFDKQLEIASIDNMQHALTADGRIPLFVNTYSTVTPTTQVTYTCTTNGKEIVGRTALKQHSNFAWSGNITLPAKFEDELITVHVQARYANGETAQTQRSFLYNTQDRVANNVEGKSWTNLLGTARHLGQVKEALKLPLKPTWVNNAGGNIFMVSPVVADNKVYIATMDEDLRGEAAIVCMDATSGKLLWRHAVENSIKNSIALEKGNVFAQDVDGNLYAVNAQSGELAWKKKLQVSVLPALVGGLCTADGKVYAGSGKGLAAFDAVTGQEIWRNTSWGQGAGSTATLALNDNVIIGNAHWGAMHANDVKTGKHLWSMSGDGIRHRSSSPAMKDGLLYVISDQSFFVIDPQKGEIITKKELGYSVNVTSTPLITEDEIIFGTAQRGVIALDRKTLEEKWMFQTQEAMIFTCPYVRNPSNTVEPVLF